MAITQEEYQKAVELLPTSGEMKYEDWMDAMRKANLHRAADKAMDIKTRGLVTFRLVANEGFSSTLWVKRV